MGMISKLSAGQLAHLNEAAAHSSSTRISTAKSTMSTYTDVSNGSVFENLT